MIIVWGSIDVRPENLAAALALSLEHVQRSRKEPGCISHSVQIDVENDTRLIFFEEWESMAVLQEHFAVPDSGAFVTDLSNLADAPPTMKIYEAHLAGS